MRSILCFLFAIKVTADVRAAFDANDCSPMTCSVLVLRFCIDAIARNHLVFSSSGWRMCWSRLYLIDFLWLQRASKPYLDSEHSIKLNTAEKCIGKSGASRT